MVPNFIAFGRGDIAGHLKTASSSAMVGGMQVAISRFDFRNHDLRLIEALTAEFSNSATKVSIAIRAHNLVPIQIRKHALRDTILLYDCTGVCHIWTCAFCDCKPNARVLFVSTKLGSKSL